MVNPFAAEIEYPDDRLQSRRDHPKYLNLIKAVTFLSQMGRAVKRAEGKDGQTVSYVEVTRQDIEAAGGLMREAFGRNPDDLNGVSRALLAQVERMVAERAAALGKQEGGRSVNRADITFTRRDIREYTGWSHMRVKRYLRQLLEMEYLLVESSRHGFGHGYTLAAVHAGEGLVTWSGDGQGLVTPETRRNLLAAKDKTTGVVKMGG